MASAPHACSCLRSSRRSARRRWCAAGSSLLTSDDLGQILVAAAREAYEIELAIALSQHPGERVRGLQRGNDALETRHFVECLDGVAVGDRDVACAAGVTQMGVL